MEAAHIAGAEGSGGTELARARVEFKIGGQSNEIQAKQEAREFQDPIVFTNRSAIFPNPQNFGLVLKTVSVTPHQWPKPPSPMNQFYIQLTVDIEGPDQARIMEWVRRVNQAVKVFMPGAYGATSERAQHLAETGRANPMTQGAASPSGTHIGLGGDREAHLATQGITPATKEGAKPVPQSCPEAEEDSISRRTLEGMDKAAKNLVEGNVGVTIQLPGDQHEADVV
jgi:hypothetical protein